LPTDFARNNAFGRAIFEGWTVQGIMNHIGGPSLNVILGFDAVGDGRAFSDRPDAVPGVSPYVHGSDPLNYLNPAAYDLNGPASQARFGNLGYNTVVGPGQFTWDLGIHKSFPVYNENRITFRLEMFNWLNHPTFNLDPYGYGFLVLAAPNFGQIQNGGPGREIQLALRYAF
jgi:hypothetical protein